MKNSIIFISCILYSCTSTQINEKSIIQDDAFFELKKSHTYKTCETGVKNINNYNLINNQWGTFKLKRGKLKLCQYCLVLKYVDLFLLLFMFKTFHFCVRFF